MDLTHGAARLLLGAAKQCVLSLQLVVLLSFVLLLEGEGKTFIKQMGGRSVRTKYGRIRGVLIEFPNRELRPVEAYFGLQYASLLNGKLRFMPATGPTEEWEGIRVALKHRPPCPQKIFRDEDLRKMYPRVVAEQQIRLNSFITDQREDCLNLNIYVPTPEANSSKPLGDLAVMVFIHGESYDTGTGNAYDGSVLASYGNVITVTINYRLGVLGFLSTGNSVAPGNYALLDIAAAVHWIKQNIFSFGGNPNKLTLFGHGHGAALVNDLLISPMSRGGALFQRVILQSGSATSPWSIATDHVRCTEELAKKIGCSIHLKNSDDLVKCLRNKTVIDLLESVPLTPKYSTCFGPVISHRSGVLPRGIKELLSQPLSAFNDANVMFGAAKYESVRYLKQEDFEQNITDVRKDQLLRTFVHNTFTYQKQRMYDILDHHYTDWESSLERRSRRENILELLSDGLVVAPIIQVGNYHSDQRKAKTYFYSFNFSPPSGRPPGFSDSIHGDELPYVFGAPLVNGLSPFQVEYNQVEEMISKAIMTYWTNFAKSGNPNQPSAQSVSPEGNSKNRFTGLQWPQYNSRTQNYLHIGKRPKISHHYRGRKIALWLDLIPKLHHPFDKNTDTDSLTSSTDMSTFDEPERLWDSSDILPFFMTVPPTTKPLTENVTTPLDKINLTTTHSVFSVENTRNTSVTAPELLPSSPKPASGRSDAKGNGLPLSITIAVGCSLLFLNILIFAGIFYQRHKILKHKNAKNNVKDIKFRAKDVMEEKNSELEAVDLLSKTESGHVTDKIKMAETQNSEMFVPNRTYFHVASQNNDRYDRGHGPHGYTSMQHMEQPIYTGRKGCKVKFVTS